MKDPFEDYLMSTFSFDDDPPSDPPADPPGDPVGTDTGGTVIIKPGEFEENPKKQ